MSASQRTMRLVACVVIVSLLAGVASAQPGKTAPVRDPVSEDLAFGLSLGGAVVSYGLLGAGIGVYARGGDGEGLVIGGSIAGLFAPAIGHWPAGQFLTRGFWVRMVGVGFAGFAGIAAICEGGFGYVDHDVSEDCDRSSTNLLLAIAGAFYLGGAVDDVVTVRDRVRVHNRRARDLALVPAPMRGGAGLALTGTF
jgi:hypothetical protein